MDNAIQEAEILASVAARLRAQLPSGWVVAVSTTRGPAREWADDAWLELGLGRERARFVVEVKPRVRPQELELRVLRAVGERTADSRLDEAAAPASRRVFMSRFLSPRSRELLTRAGWNYADATGNVRIALEHPAMFVLLQGLARDPDPEDQPLRALRGAVAGKVVRALLDFAPPYGVRELAKRAETSPAMVSRVTKLLADDAIVQRTESGGVQRVDWRALLRRWSEDYAFARSNRVVAYLDLRGRPAVLDALRRTQIRYAITGAFAAEQMRTVAASPRLAIYSDQPERLADELGLVAQKSPATVLLAAPYDTVVFERTQMRDKLCFAAPSQVAVDLLTGGDRDPQIAAPVMQWMEENERVWRA